MRVEHVSDEEFLRYARLTSHPIPIEQSPAWDPFDASVPSRSFWRRLAVFEAPADADAPPVCVVAFTHHVGNGFTYLWAKHGPIWLDEQSARSEREVRAALRAYITEELPAVDFVRLHAAHPAPDLCELLQTVTYDRTVVIDLTVPAEDYLAGLAKKFRYTVRKALGHEATTVNDETGMDAEAFAELYEIYLETAGRDGFGIFAVDVYWSMLKALAPHVRLFVARRTDGPRPGRAVAWLIATVYDNAAVYYYAAGNAEARDTDATVRLLWDTMAVLRDEGVTQFDMMGVDSPRAPQLAGVGLFKRKWGAESTIDGAWDLPLKPWKYRSLRLALRLKRLLRR
ncbi:MAG: FemAB family protein [Actinobacteria bacterium HGW-Actinobacteria-4]|nr:MAG: FemAB family protein [Actinobacteria bacterium HGW-Actinobacteria-4]